MKFKLLLTALTFLLILFLFLPKNALAACGDVILDPASGDNSTIFNALLRNCDLPASSYEVEIAQQGGGSQTYTFTDIGSGTYSASIGLLSTGNYAAEFRESGNLLLIRGPFTVTESSGGNGAGSGGGGVSTIGAVGGDCGGVSISTAIGCISIENISSLTSFFLTWGISIGGGVAILLIVVSSYRIMTSQGDPRRLQGAQELFTSALAGLILLVFSVMILRVIGVDILQLF